MDMLAMRLHGLFHHQFRLSFPFDEANIPKNGIYILFEEGEIFGSFDRIVRIGTHTGNNQLRSRLKQHFIKENKNRSIFRKNIGRCILNQTDKTYLPIWELDPTPKKDRAKKEIVIDKNYEERLEKQISNYIQNHLSFCVFAVDTKEARLFWETKIISTLAQSNKIKPSDDWLGYHPTKDKIKQSGLWQVNGLNGNVLTNDEFDELVKIVQSC